MTRPLPVIRLALAAAFLSAGRLLVAQDSASTQTPSDSASIATGRVVYQGRGACVQCHGEEGQGTPDGPSLTKGPWTLSDGSFESLIHVTRHAGWGSRGRDGEPQRMRGPTVLDSADVRRVAAYVFSISRAKPRPK